MQLPRLPARRAVRTRDLGSIMNKLAIAITVAVLIASAANAGDTTKICFKVDDENSPTVTVSGRVSKDHHNLPKNSELRAADGFYLKLDTPLRANAGAGCVDWDEIAAMDNQHPARLVRWNNRHVIVVGRLSRVGSALVYPPIFVEILRIKGD